MLKNISQREILSNVKSNGLSKSYFVGAVLQLMAIILWFVPSLKASAIQGSYEAVNGQAVSEMTYSAFTNTYAMFQFFEGALVLHLIFIAFMVLSLMFLVKPLITNEVEVRNRLAWSKVSAILNLLTFFMVYFSSKSDLEKYEDIGAVCRWTFGGWLFVLVGVALLVLAFLISSKTKIYKSKKEIKAYADVTQE